jgi:hypothetical protein
MANTDEVVASSRQECLNHCHREDWFYISKSTAWVTCIVTHPGSGCECRDAFILSRGVYQPVFNDLFGLGFRVEMCMDNENGREWKTIYNCCGGRTLLELHADISNEQIAKVATEFENGPTFYRPVNLLPHNRINRR